MKVLLVSSPTWATWAPSYSLGLLTAVLKDAGHLVNTIDLNIEIYNSVNDDDRKLWLDQYGGYWDDEKKVREFFDRYHELLHAIAERLAMADAPMVGFSVNSASRHMAQQLNRLMKAHNPQIITIFGGPDCFRAYHGLAFMADPNIDGICTLEGDVVLPELVEIIAKGEFGKQAVKGFVIRDRQTGILLDGDDPDPIMELDKLPLPDYSWANFKQYSIQNRLTMMLSRGCINRCSFCSEGVNFKKYRFRSALNIIAEIKQHLLMLGNPPGVFINFNDSLINGNMKEFVGLCDLILQEGLKFSWGGMALFRQEMTMEVIVKMRQAGCVELMWGLEAGNDHVLQLMRKRFDVALAERIIRDCFAAGIKQYTNIIVGFPGETPTDFEETAAFVTRNNRYFEAIGLPYMTLHRNSHVYENASSYNIRDRYVHLEWELEDGTNTFPIRQKRRQQLMDIIENKFFDQGKYGDQESKQFCRLPNRAMSLLRKLRNKIFGEQQIQAGSSHGANMNDKLVDMAATAEKWGSEEHSFKNTLERGWSGSPIVLAYRSRMITGSDNGNPSLLIMNHLSPGCKSGKVLVLGCGQSFAEHWLVASETVQLAHGIDVSPGAIEKARAEVASQDLTGRVTHEVMDINNLSLIENSYDGLLISQAMHHFENLEHICAEIVKGLKPGAPIVIDDFVGPTRFQYSDERLNLMNRLLACLPPHLQKPAIERIPIEAFLRDDPSEGVRCGDIPDIVRKSFLIERELPYGGSIIYQLLQDIVPMIRHDDPGDRALVSLLVTFEEYLIKSRAMESDFVMYFGRNQKGM